MAKEEISTTGYAKNYAEFDEPIELDSTTTTKTVFRAHMSDRGVGGEIIRYKLGLDGKNEDIKQNFNSIPAGEGVKIRLSSNAVSALLDGISKYNEIRNSGISTGRRNYSIVSADDCVISDKNAAELAKYLIKSGSYRSLWGKLSSESPEIATALADSRIQQSRRESLAIFERFIADEKTSENQWQKFFESNKWIFGLGLRYQILEIDCPQATYGGTTIYGNGTQKGDFLAYTQASTKYTCLVEIKKATTNLLEKEKYRNGAYRISSELAGAVAQLQANCGTWEIEGATLSQNRDVLGDIHTVQPKGLLIIGNTFELSNDRGKWTSFERFRQNLRNPEVITFDELKARAEFIVEDFTNGEL